MPESLSKADVTGLLRRWREQRGAPDDRLVRAVEREPRRIAAGYMRREQADHPPQPTALVNEAYLRLVEDDVKLVSSPNPLTYGNYEYDVSRDGSRFIDRVVGETSPALDVITNWTGGGSRPREIERPDEQCAKVGGGESRVAPAPHASRPKRASD